ncbi:MAG: flippase [Candidatus Doudnabacteria bacterium]
MATPSKNIFWLSISRVGSLILLFLAYTQLFRYLGPEDYGKFQFVLSYITLFGIVIDFGLQQYIIKKMSEDRSQVKAYFQNFLAVEILLASMIYLAMIAVAWFNQYEASVFYAILIGGFGVCLHGLTYPFLAVISAYYDLKKAALLNFIASVVNVVIIFIVILTHQSFVVLLIQQGIYASLAIAVYSYFVRQYIGRPQILRGITRLNFKLVKKMFIAALPFAVLVGFSTVYNRIDVVLIKSILGYSQVGFYGAAYKIYDLLAFFPAVVSHSLYPLFSSLMAENKLGEVKKLLERYMKFMLALALPMATGGMLLSGQLIRLVAGEEYAAAAPVLSVLVWAPAILFVYIVVNSIVISQLTKFATLITGFNVVINIIGNLVCYLGLELCGSCYDYCQKLCKNFYFIL